MIVAGRGQQASVCFQPCEGACAGAFFASQNCGWQQNLSHYIGLSVAEEVQPVPVPKEHEKWDKQKKMPPQFGLTSMSLICAASKSMGSIGKHHPFFLKLTF